MYKLLFLDTETTGNTPEDRLCQIAYTDGNKLRTEALYKPTVPISIESMAVHHITTKMVANKPAFKFSLEYAYLKNFFADEQSVLVAHNAPFDVGMLKHEGLVPDRIICTLRVARFLDDESKISSYRLQYLRYYLDIELDEQVTAHDALGDVLVLEKLFERLQKKIMQKLGKTADEAVAYMIEISSKPSLMRKFNFGKHKDKTVEEVSKMDAGYLEWLLKQKMENEESEEDWIYTLKYYLGKL